MVSVTSAMAAGAILRSCGEPCAPANLARGIDCLVMRAPWLARVLDQAFQPAS